MLELALKLPPDSCAGHFPGRPIVPGVLQLVLVEEALAAEEPGLSINSIGRVRFRKQVTPEAAFHLRTESTDRGTRFTLECDGETASDGTLGLGRLPASDESAQDVELLGGVPGPENCLPHAPPMLLVEGVVSLSDDGGTCRCRVAGDCQLVRSGRLPAVAVVEVAAQAFALVEAASAPPEAAPAEGYLVGLSRAAIHVSSVPVGAPLLASVRRVALAPPMAQAEVKVSIGQQGVLEVALTAWLPEAT